ncbi:hypothetical protein LO772_12780 [Yinghuangia sp. ASG 101]|uniref:hypothetical protein n=1 Tax=Yinghuangia sp. ASG 101 TaxID=2896848 RepID=UPI001E30CD7F|nr:hypothetical protein [Yinghuangia sp. ASG 101]UGQ14378.1 hypothetical protein LO772_12780 [Yinghuangia sp. ASG 101]
MASIAGWWAIPAVALVGVVIWTMWRGRTPKPMGMRESVAHYEHFQATLTRVVHGESAEAPSKRPAGKHTPPENADRPRTDPAGRRPKNRRAGGATEWEADRRNFPEDPNAAEPRAAAHRDVP